MENDAVGRVHELPAQIIRHEDGAEIFAPAGAPVLALAAGDALFHFVQAGVNIHLQVEALGDGQIAVPDPGEGLRNGLPFGSEVIAGIKQVGYLIVFPEALSGRAGNQVTARGLQLQDAAHLTELFVIRQGTAAKLCYDTFKHESSSGEIQNSQFRIQN